MILIISHPGDVHAAAVRAALSHCGAEVVFLDTAEFPRNVALTMGYPGSMRARIGDSVVDLGEAKAIWWRRPQPLVLHDEIADRAFAFGECHAALSGLWSCLDAEWVNNPDRDQIAARKPYQLKVATAVGFSVPRTCITSDPAVATEFAATQGDQGTIYKAFAATEQSWRETRLLGAAECSLLDSVRFAPVIFQQHIKAVADLRITVVGDDIFAASIVAAESDYQYDFRVAMNSATVTPHQLPDEVTRQIRELMSSLGLVYGTIDMRLTPDGEYVFLEINPAGQWLFVEERTGQPIAQALAEYLAGFRAPAKVSGSPHEPHAHQGFQSA